MIGDTFRVAHSRNFRKARRPWRTAAVQLSVLGLLAGGLAGSSLLMSSTPAAADQGPWVPTSLPAPSDLIAPSVDVQSVSCTSAGNCAAVGYYHDNSDNPQGLLLTESSGTWGPGAEATLPGDTGSAFDVSLTSVSCPSAGDCTAVGSYTDSSYVSHGLMLTETAGVWGTGVAATLPAEAGSDPEVQLTGVSCASAGNCSAVGSYYDSSFQQQGLLLTETAGTWGAGTELTYSGGPLPDPDADLESISCGSAGNCTAVGTYDGNGGQGGLLVSQVAGTWGSGGSPKLPSGGMYSTLSSVSCTSAGNCSAAGTYTDSGGDFYGLLLLTETSGTWGTPPVVATGVDVVNMVVSCTAAGVCGAVGAGYGQAVAVNETASTWGTPDTLTLPAISTDYIYSISCGSAGNCAAVGSISLDSGADLPMRITETSGTWGNGIAATLPSNAGVESVTVDQDARFYSVSCPSSGNCSAVGQYIDNAGFYEGLMDADASATWATGVESTEPTAPPWSVQLNAVSCPVAGSCVGVGFAGPPSTESGIATLAVESGGAWNYVQATLPANSDKIPNATLTSISCPTAGNCSAVGYYEDDTGTTQGLLLDETSGTWATGIEATSGAGAYISSVSCPSAGNCIAIADTFGAGFIYTETSGTWGAPITPSYPAGAGEGAANLVSASCGSAGNCSIVGSYSTSEEDYEGVLFTETAGTWAKGIEAVLPAGANASPDVTLYSVSCPSAGTCSAVGDYLDTSNHLQGILLKETSGTWSTGTEASPPAGATANPEVTLSSVSCPSAGNCSVVGTYDNGSTETGVFFITESSGTWGAGTAATLPSGITRTINDLTISCGSVGNCAAVGAPFGDGNHDVAMIFTETSGTWDTGVDPTLPANASSADLSELLAVSCPAVGSCSAVGAYDSGEGYPVQGLIETEPSATTGGSGTMTVTPATISAGSGNNTLTFTYTAVGATTDGEIQVAIPTGWSPPSVTATAAGYSTSTCGTVSISSSSILVSGVTLANGATCTITFGSTAGSGPGADAPSTAGVNTFTTSEESISGGSLTPLATSPSVTVSSPGPYSPLPPIRICDTRANNPSHLTGAAAQCNGDTIAAHSVLTINVANADDSGVGSFGVPADATAVVLNVTVVNPAQPGYVTAYPAGATQPFASNINYVTNEVVPNLVEVGVGTNGDVSFYASEQTDLVVDAEGYTAPTAAGGVGAGLYTALPSPVRICDTRAGNPSGLTSPNNQCNGTDNAGMKLAAGGIINVKVAGINGIPVGAAAAVFNVTVTDPTQPGYLTAYPQGEAAPFASNVNYLTNQSTSNRVIVPISVGGADPGDLSVLSSEPADVVVDVSGYYSAAGGAGALFTPEAAPVRICDTRPNNPSNLTGAPAQCNGRTISARETFTLNVSGLAGVPTGATAVVINLTGVAPTAPTYFTVFPNAIPDPIVSDLNEVTGEVRANLVVATLSSTGTITIYNLAGSNNAVVDVLGWYSQERALAPGQTL